jgi:glucose/arabinose dehydrogenase
MSRRALVLCALAACGGDDAVIGGDAAGPDVPAALDAATADVAPIDASADAAPIDASPPDAGDAPPGLCNPRETPLRLQAIGTLDDRPVDVEVPPGDTRIFVVEQHGAIHIIDGDDNVLREPFLDVTDIIRQTGEEAGLLVLAFHPDFAQNRRFLINYSAADEQNMVLAEGTASLADENRADSELDQLLTVPHPASNHNGGWLDFGPDGKLYLSIGDGSNAANGQNTNVLLGKVLRLDVDTPGEIEIPPDNPFVAGGGRGEVWVYGLRNPWRNSFDASTGALYIADVGQNAWEEVNVQPPGSTGGENYGWRDMEASHCFSPPTGCATEGRTLPIYEYGHTAAGGSITGGQVYRGSLIPNCRGWYFLADYRQVFVRSIRWDGGGGILEESDWPALARIGNNPVLVGSFGRDANHELLLADLRSRKVHRVVPATP